MQRYAQRHQRLSIIVGLLLLLGLLGLVTAHLRGAAPGSPPDTDGDGQDDLSELLAGTDPHDPQSLFRIVGQPVRQPNGLWRLTWLSVSNRTYTLQRLADGAGDFSENSWVNVKTVVATGATTFADAPGSSARDYFRVQVATVAGPPILSSPVRLAGGGWRLFWTSVAGRSYQLQRTLQPQGDHTQWFDVATLVATGPMASADDVAGGSTGKRYYRVLEVPGSTDATSTPVGLTNLTQFVPIGGDGRPQNGVALVAAGNGSLPPFEFRPGGRDAAGQGQGLFLRFLQGARQVEQNGALFIEFSAAEAGFGPGSPIQLATPLSASGAATRRLPMGGLKLEDLLTAFGLPPDQGLDLVLFGTLHLKLTAGLFEDGRLKHARFAVDVAGLPLPGESGDYPEFSIDLPPTDGIRIPFFGEFTLPDGSGSSPTLSIPAKRPVWLTLRPNGHLSLVGRADMSFPQGPSFSVDLSLDDPVYHLQMVATGLHVPLIGSLTEFLPNTPEACLPAAPTPAQLSAARVCLSRYDCAFLNFSVATVGASPASEPGATPDSPPGEVNTSTAVLDAWSYSALATAGQSLPLASLQGLLRQTGRSAAANRGMNQILCNQLALVRARQAVVAGAMTGDPAAQASLDAAISEATAAAIRGAASPDATLNLNNFLESARCLLEMKAILQAANNTGLDPALTTALTGLFQRFSLDETTRLGVAPNAFAPPDGGVVSGLNRFVALQKLADWSEFLGDAQALGIDLQISAPVAESLSQLALRVWQLASARLSETQAAHDYLGFLYSLEDVLELVRIRESGLLPENAALAPIPRSGDLPAYGARLGAVFQADPTRQSADVALANQSAELRRLTRVLHDVPSGVTAVTGPCQRAYDRLETTLSTAFNTLTTHRSLPVLLDLLEAGRLQSQVRDQFHFAEAVSWEGVRLPALIARIAEVAGSQQGWSELHQATTTLLKESDRLSADADAGHRKAYLDQAVVLLHAAHDVAVALWEDEDSRRQANPLLQVADLLLPGDLHVDKVAGSVAFDRSSGALDGAFSGELRLPKFDLALTVDNASFASGGEFDLNAHGSLALPSAADPRVRLSVTSAHPLHVQFRAPRELKVSGGGKVEAGGMTFEAYFGLEDPLYVFGASAQGIRFDLADKLRLMVPTLAADEVYDADTAKVLNDYFGSINSSLEGLVPPPAEPGPASMASMVSPQDVAPVATSAGEPPAFEPAYAPSPLDALEAWANAELVDARLHLIRDYAATVKSVTQQLKVVADSLRSQPGKLDLPGLLVRDRLMEKICLALHNKQGRGASGEYAQLVASPEFASFLTETENAIIAILTSSDPALVERAPEVASLAGGFDEQMRCFRQDYDPTRLMAAYQQFLTTQSRNLFEHFGLNPVTGEALIPPTRLNSITNVVELRVGVTNFIKFNSYVQLTGQAESMVNYRTATRTLALRWRHLVYEEIKKLAPANTQDFYAKLDRLRHARPDPGQCRAPEVPELLKLYADLRKWRTEIGLIVELSMLSFEWPAEGIEQPYGPDATFELSMEISNATKAWTEALLWADNLKTDGTSIGDGRSNRVTKCDWQTRYVPEEGRTRPVLVERRLDLEQLVGDDFKKRSPAEARVAGQATGSPKAQASVDVAARNALQAAEAALLQKAGVLRKPAGLALMETLVKLATWAQEHDPAQLPVVQVHIAEMVDSLTADSGGTPAATPAPAAIDSTSPRWVGLAAYAGALIDASAMDVFKDAPSVRQSFLTQASKLIRAEAGVAGRLSSLIPSIRPVDLGLPGDLMVNRVFGEVQFHRDTGLVNGTFGGRLEFPDLQNAYFEINKATLDSNFNFSIDAATAGPLPIDGVSLAATLKASGGLHQPLLLNGTGKLNLNNGPDVAVTLSFDQAARTLSFDTAVTDLQSLRLTDDAVLFNAGFGFTLKPTAQTGELHATGTAGLFAKGPLPTTVTRTNFHLIVDGLTASILFHPGGLELHATNGTLRLPDFFKAGLCTPAAPGSGPAIALSPLHPVVVSFATDDGHGNPSLAFAGEIDFANIGFNVPGMEGLGGELCSARLLFSDRQLPAFTNLNGTVSIPLPPGQTSRVDILNGAWRVDGFPTGKIALRNDLTLLDQGGLSFKLLALGNTNCPRGSALTLSRGTDGLPHLAVDGGVEVDLPATMLTGENGDKVGAVACGTLYLDPPPALPDLRIDTLGATGTFHLGGAGGLLVTGASLTFSGFENLFNPTPDHPFQAHLGGTLKIPSGPAFTLNDARFVLFDRTRLPRFDIAGMGYDARGFTLAQALPAVVNGASFTFKNRNLELPYLLAPTNVTLTLSAAVSIPSADDPYVAGRVDNIKVSVDANGIPRIESIAGLGLQVGGMAIPPIEELGGQLYIGGLTPDPSKMYFAGRVAGSYQGYKLKALVAFNLAGPIGMCLDVNAGNVGIPVAQTGILISGASGGISFVNKNTDPCDFTTYMNANGEPLSTMVQLPAAMSWASLKEITNRFYHAVQAYLPPPPGPSPAEVIPPLIAPPAVPEQPSAGDPGSGPALASLPVMQNGFDCPGDCPPATVNIFCQPHPDQARFTNRVIAKFSSIDEPTLNNVLHITPQSIAALGSSATAVATNIAHQIRGYVFSITPPPKTDLLGPGRSAQILSVVNESFDAMERVFADVLKGVLSTNNASEFYAVIRDKVYEGAPCPDCTFKVTGTVTHVAVSSFLSGTVGATLSTAGTVGLVGNVNVLGIPVGKAKGFIAATDEKGNPNPSLCGEVRAVVGPLDLGDVAASMTCKDCVTGVLAEFAKLTQCLGEPVIRQLAQKVAPQLATLPGADILTLMSDNEKLAFMAELFQLPPQADLAACFLTQFSNAWTRVQPELMVCGQIEPKIFGFPMAGKLVDLEAGATKTNLAGLYSFSPSYMIASALGAATRVPLFFLFPPQDSARFGFNVSVPDPGQSLLAAMSGRFRTPSALADYSREGFDYMLANATYTTEYSLHPLGAELLNAQARVLLPNLTAHPARPGSGWLPPELRPGGLPSRLDVLLLALEAGKLADPLWKGTAADLQQLDPRLANLDLQHDYFPHGGMAGAAKLQFPRALTEAPPDYLGSLVDPNSSTDLMTRLGDASDFLRNYVLAFTNRGSLAFYIPAPNPPFFTHPDGSALTPQQMLAAIQTFDASTIQDAGVTQLYPVELAFLKGWFNAQLLGIPIGTGSIVALPAGQGRPTGVLSVQVDGPTGGWLKSFVTTASLHFEMTQAPTLTISNWGSDLLAHVEWLRGPAPAGTNTATWDQMRRTAWQDFSAQLITNLPKASLDAAIALTMPAPISDVVAASGSARVVAYSPRFEPTFIGTGPVAEARRQGGIAFLASLDLKANGTKLVSIPDAQLSVIPQPSGLPALSGRFSAPTLPYQGVGLNNALIDFSTAPNPHFTASGSASPVSIGGPSGFRIAAVTGGSLTGRIDIARSGPNATTATLLLGAAQLQLPGLFTETILIHGAGGATSPFSFSTSDPWSAQLEINNNLTLSSGGVTVLQVTNGSVVGPLTLQGVGTNRASASITIRGGTTVALFPGRSYGRNVTLGQGANATLVVNSDATFDLTGSFAGALPTAGLGIPASAVADGTLHVTQDSVVLTGNITADVLASVGAGGAAASGTVTITRSGAVSFTGSGTVTLGSFSSGLFTLESLNPGVDAMTAVLNNVGLTLSGAYLRVNGLFSQRVLLPPITVYANGNFTNQSGPLAFSVGGFAFDQINFNLERTGSTWLLRNFGGRVKTVGGVGTLAVAGNIGSDGAFNLVTSAGSTLNVGGFTLNNATMAFSRTPPNAPSLAFNGSLSVTDLGTLLFAGNVQPNGTYSLTNVLNTPTLGGFPLATVTNVLTRGGSDYRARVVALSPLAYWRLGEGGGSVALSETLPILNGTYLNTPDLSQKGGFPDSVNAGTCATLNGTGQSVLVKDQDAFTAIGAELTVEAWVRVDKFDNPWATILSKGDSAWRLERDNTGNTLRFDLTGVTPLGLVGSRPVNDQQWHHVVGVYDGRAKYLFIDGELDAWTPATGTIAQNKFDVMLGDNAEVGKRSWHGTLDEVALYTRALTAREVLDHYQAGGGVTLSMSSRVNIAGFATADLFGSLSDTGALQLSAAPVSLNLGGFNLGNGQLWFSRSAGQLPSLRIEADLTVPLGPSSHIAGSVSGAGLIDVSGSLPSGRIAAFDFTSLGFHLSGPSMGPTLAATASLAVQDLATLDFNGLITPGGTLALTNVFTGPTFFNFPVNNLTNVIRRSPSDYPSLVLADGPTGYWRLNESALTPKLVDATGGLHGGTFTGGVTLQQAGALVGSADHSVLLDGATGFATIAREADFDFTTALTVEAWVRTTGWTKDWQAIVTKGDTAWRLSRYSNTRRISFDTTSAAGAHSLPGVRNVDDGLWHHVVAVCDGLAKYLYMDGTLEAWAPYSSPVSVNNAAVMIGENAEASGRFFRGWIDEVAVYGRSLTASEVLDHYQAGGGSVLAVRTKLGFGGPLGNLELFGALAPSGNASLQASASSIGLRGFSLNNAYFSLARSPLAGGLVNLGGDFSFPDLGASPRVTGTLGTTGQLGFGVNNLSASILAFKFDNLSLSVAGDVSALSGSMTVSGKLGLGSFPAYTLGGTFLSTGPISLSYNQGLSLGGFYASDGALTLDRAQGLRATGTFDLSVAGTHFNSAFYFSGNIGYDGTFALTGSNSLKIGGFTTASSAFTLDNTHVAGSTSIHLGVANTDINLAVSLDGNGISATGSGSADTGWIKVYDWFPGGDSAGDVWARVVGTLSLSSDATGSITGSFGATFGIWERVKNNPPSDINSADVHVGDTWNVGSDGTFGVSYDFTGVTVDTKQIPPWHFNQKSWGFDLW